MQRMAKTYRFRDATSLVKWVRLALYAQLAVCVVALVSGYLEYRMLTGFQAGEFVSQEAAVSAADASDARQRVVGIVQMIVYVVSGFLILRWIHRASWNAHALGARRMQFTPGWSIGWYFVPFLNLWKPFQAMKEIWKASHDPDRWQTGTVPSLLGNWWGLWLLMSFVSNASMRLALRAQDIDDLVTASMVVFASDAIGIPLALIFLVLLRRIDEAQDSSAAAGELRAAELAPDASPA